MTVALRYVRVGATAGARAGLPPVPWPVPAAALDDVLRAPVALDRLLEYADEYADEYGGDGAWQHDGPPLGPAIARLAYLVGVDELDDHLYEHAEYHLRIGLRHAPGNVSLRSHLGLALWGLGRRSEAVDAFAEAIGRCRRSSRFAPLLWLLAARAYVELGRARDALPLLDDLAGYLPDGEAFWDLLATARRAAGTR
jgi:tetratricopeptide (TPR) repeat protein